MRVEHLDWQHPTPLPIYPDVVLGADIVFDTTVIPSLVGYIIIILEVLITYDQVTTLGLLLSPSCEAFIACTVRNEDTHNFFLDRSTRLLHLHMHLSVFLQHLEGGTLSYSIVLG